VTINTSAEIYYDPYDIAINANPYPVYKRLRDEAPLYYNEEHDFYAVSRYADVERGLKDRDTFISGRGGILELIKAGLEMPRGVVIFEDPPTHTIHRGLLSRMFTPRKVAALEPQIRQYCAEALDPLVGSGRFDLIATLGATMPMRVIGQLIGIPEADQDEIRRRSDDSLRTDPGSPMKTGDGAFESPTSDMFGDYVDWRVEHPSDDIMTELLNVEFEDETGTRRHLTRDELLTYLSVVAGAGNETTTRLIGWTGKVLADHPEQRRQIAEDRSLVNNAIEEILRFEPPAPHVARYVAKDAEFQGSKVPAGSAILNLVGAANRDEARFPDGDTFNINRPSSAHLTFGLGAHFCLGAALARLEGRIALDELLQRFPDWDVDLEGARLSPTSTVRGWECLPVVVP
jgi:cytochrome P450